MYNKNLIITLYKNANFENKLKITLYTNIGKNYV